MQTACVQAESRQKHAQPLKAKLLEYLKRQHFAEMTEPGFELVDSRILMKRHPILVVASAPKK